MYYSIIFIPCYHLVLIIIPTFLEYQKAEASFNFLPYSKCVFVSAGTEWIGFLPNLPQQSPFLNEATRRERENMCVCVWEREREREREMKILTR